LDACLKWGGHVWGAYSSQITLTCLWYCL